jgi:hypothetical protein
VTYAVLATVADVQYPFMDWLRFNEHWQARDGLLLAVALRRPLNKEASVAAYFVLMVLAIGSQLCKNEQLSGLLRAQEYYSLACNLLPVIVQLHNLTNIQGVPAGLNCVDETFESGGKGALIHQACFSSPCTRFATLTVHRCGTCRESPCDCRCHNGSSKRPELMSGAVVSDFIGRPARGLSNLRRRTTCA